jgi:hypothetical protein
MATHKDWMNWDHQKNGDVLRVMSWLATAFFTLVIKTTYSAADRQLISGLNMKYLGIYGFC